MYYDDHPPPHIHVRYAGRIAQVDIVTFDIIAGSLPPAVLRKLRRWGRTHQGALALNWLKAQMYQKLDPV